MLCREFVHPLIFQRSIYRKCLVRAICISQIPITSEYTPLSDLLALLQIDSHFDSNICDQMNSNAKRLPFRVAKIVAILINTDGSVSFTTESATLIYMGHHPSLMRNRIVSPPSADVNDLRHVQKQIQVTTLAKYIGELDEKCYLESCRTYQTLLHISSTIPVILCEEVQEKSILMSHTRHSLGLRREGGAIKPETLVKVVKIFDDKSFESTDEHM